ncbi:cysteine--tRNA ligase [Orrella marina]|uniref:Cysteine--tRNA ligase n=1 Tax=Orrella marina TaxID=2163011 RepID=A0A2R4XIG0_9BURK|nr:cysteine--tRNA ligase [Orrella marina]AWB33607.1 cysteine--tRNA ligase [Orrella marina]
MLQIYDSLSRNKRPFKPARDGEVRMYVCGMTVYDFCHLGHARMLVSFDVVQRWLRVLGYKVTYVRNITDIDDKIIRRAVETDRKLSDVTRFFIDAMHADEAALGVQAPDHQPRATAFVPDMLDIIDRLEQRGLAYRAEDGDVNYAVRNFADYGKLSGKTLDQLRAGERVAVSAGKRDPLDFVLWKSAKPEEPEESRWPSVYGWGRPGWHIECSAMSRSVLGLPLDIHGGGPDLKFPHHENEIAQSEGAFGGALANTWMHCGSLMVDSEKMSKSLGNFRTIRQTVAALDVSQDRAEYEPNPREAQMLRFFIVRNHYRSLQNYSPDNLVDAQSALDRLYQTLANVAPDQVEVNWQEGPARQFADAMNDDFNTAEAVAVLFELSARAHRDHDSATSGLMLALGQTLGLFTVNPQTYIQSSSRYTRRAIEAREQAALEQEQESGPEQGLMQAGQVVEFDARKIEDLIAQRAQAKKDKDFKRADSIREELAQAGVLLEDKPGGVTQWRRG